jgi:hypothetical protein
MGVEGEGLQEQQRLWRLPWKGVGGVVASGKYRDQTDFFTARVTLPCDLMMMLLCSSKINTA